MMQHMSTFNTCDSPSAVSRGAAYKQATREGMHVTNDTHTARCTHREAHRGGMAGGWWGIKTQVMLCTAPPTSLVVQADTRL